MAAPSFLSFPDLDGVDDSKDSKKAPVSSRTKPSESIDDDELGTHDKRERQSKKEREHRREKKRRRSRERKSSEQNRHQAWDADEKAKEKEDRERKARQQEESKSTPLYTLDTKGDPLNLTLDGLHARSVPRYYRDGAGKVIGLTDAFRVVKGSSKGVEIAWGAKRRTPRYVDKQSYKMLTTTRTKQVLPSKKPVSPEEDLDFIRLPATRKPDPMAYRSITRLSDRSSESGSSSAGGLSTDDEERDLKPVLTSHQQALKASEQAVRSSPTSLSAWLTLLRHTISTTPLSSKNASRARAEISVSVLSRALAAHPENRQSVQLRLRYLGAGEDVWHSSKLRVEWEDALREVPHPEIWDAWLGWKMKNADGPDAVVLDATRAIGELKNEEARLTILWRVAIYLKEAGYIERATSLFQAQTEMTFFAPSNVQSLPFTEKLDAFEEFWESEVPRIGETGAKGWFSWDGQPASSSSFQGSALSTVKISYGPNDDPFVRWAAMEKELEQTTTLPVRSFVDGDHDPYSTVLFSDIRSMLVPVTSPSGKEFLALAFLSFLGLHIPGFASSTASWSSVLHWRSKDIFPPESKERTWESQAGVIIGKERDTTSVFGPIKDWGRRTFGTLEGIGCGIAPLWEAADLVGLDVEFLRRVFEQMRPSIRSLEWDLLGLAFESAINLKSALKVSRTLLASARDSLPLWSAHARLERSRGRNDDAKKVYEASIASAQNRPGLGRIWWDYAEMEWLSGKEAESLKIICRSAGISGTSGLDILKTKRVLEANTEAEDPDSEYWIKLRVLLELLASSPSAAIAVFDKYLARYPTGSREHEALQTAQCLMLYHHAHSLRSPMPPAILRGAVGAAVQAYPGNTLLLGVFLQSEKGEAVWGRLRDLVASGEEEGKAIYRRLWEVWIEGWDKNRWQVERARSSLSKAAVDEQTKNSPALWRIYVEFEIKTGQLNRARDVLYRAVRQCPWARDLYLLAFGPLRSVFNGKQLRDWAGVMGERGLRIRADLDEMLEGWTDDVDMEDVDSGEDENRDDIELEASQRRRLMPY